MLQTFTTWYGSLEPTLHVYWTIAIIVSIIFVIQMVLTLVGLGDTDAGGDIDISDMGDGNGDTMDTGGAIQLFTIRNAVNFMLGVGWGGVCLYDTIPNRLLLAVAAILCGCIMVAAFVVMFRQLMKLESSGSYRAEECLGQVADVYLRIPGQRSSQGKVQVSFHGSVQELPALTDGDAIASGTKVRIQEIIDGKVLVVTPL